MLVGGLYSRYKVTSAAAAVEMTRKRKEDRAAPLYTYNCQRDENQQ